MQALRSTLLPQSSQTPSPPPQSDADERPSVTSTELFLQDGKESKNAEGEITDPVAHNHNTNNTNNKNTTTTSTQWLREHAKEFLDEWTRVGLNRYVDLPMICVLGDTSSGKSSVLSSLIGLELPSASTLTTKCPVLVQLQQAKHTTQQRAVVDIQWHATATTTGSTGTSSESPRERKRFIEQKVEDFHNADPPPPPRTQLFSKDVPPPPPPPPKWEVRTIRSNWETEIPQIIQEAQQVILDFRETMVAPDVICITLWSPDCTDELTLVDLPGLVQFQHDHDASLLSQVEQVILEYVHNPRSLLLPVVPAPTNLHNSKVLQWAKNVDPTTRRTIPVLTKPDLMDPGSETDVLALLQDSTQTPSSPSHSHFQHGFYMVMNRGQAQLDKGSTLDEGLSAEQEYFESTLPWNAVTGQRLGIPSLKVKLAKVLWQVMQDSLPDILEELQSQYYHTQGQLENLGTLYHTRLEQRKFYHGLSQDLVSQVSSSLSGKGHRRASSSSPSKRSRSTGVRPSTPNRSSAATAPEAKSTTTTTTTTPSINKAGGASRLHGACHSFFQEIQGGSLATINKLVEGASVLVSSPDHPEDVRGEIIYIARSRLYACVDFCDAKDHTTEVLFDAVGYVTEQPDFEEDEVWSDGNRVFVGRAAGHFDSLRKIPCSRIRTDPTWLEEKMAQFRTDDLACFVNVDMFQQIVAEFVQDDWAPPCETLLNCLEDILKGSLQEALSQALQNAQRFPMLKTMMETTCQKVADQLLETARTQVKDHLEMEEQHPYTQDEVLMKAMNQARFQSLRGDLDMQLRLDQEGVVYDTQAIQSILDRVFAKHQQNNWMAEQMELVLSCYGQVATQRVLDRTPQICWQTCRSLAKTLQEELGCVTDDVLETCLWESPETRQKFQVLTSQLGDLQAAMDVLKTMR